MTAKSEGWGSPGKIPRPRRARLDLPRGPRVSSHCAAVTRKPRTRGLNTTDACPSPCQGPARGSPAGLLQQGPRDPGARGAENSHRLRLPRTGSDLEKRGASTVSGRLGKGETVPREEAALARGAGPAGPTALGRESPHAKARRPETGGEAPKSGPSQPHPVMLRVGAGCQGNQPLTGGLDRSAPSPITQEGRGWKLTRWPMASDLSIGPM